MLSIHFYLGISFAILISILISSSEQSNLTKFKKLYIKRFFNDPYYTLVSLLTLGFSIYVFTLDADPRDKSEENIRRLENIHKLQKATRDAFVAYITAIFAFFNVTLLPFWIVWFITYYTVFDEQPAFYQTEIGTKGVAESGTDTPAP